MCFTQRSYVHVPTATTRLCNALCRDRRLTGVVFSARHKRDCLEDTCTSNRVSKAAISICGVCESPPLPARRKAAAPGHLSPVLCKRLPTTRLACTSAAIAVPLGPTHRCPCAPCCSDHKRCRSGSRATGRPLPSPAARQAACVSEDGPPRQLTTPPALVSPHRSKASNCRQRRR